MLTMVVIFHLPSSFEDLVGLPSRLKTSCKSEGCRIPAPLYWLGKKVWLFTRNQEEWCKSDPWSMRPFPISKIINPDAVDLQLPQTMRVYSNFHVYLIKPIKNSH